jgi:hypothetical protein
MLTTNWPLAYVTRSLIFLWSMWPDHWFSFGLCDQITDWPLAMWPDHQLTFDYVTRSPIDLWPMSPDHRLTFVISLPPDTNKFTTTIMLTTHNYTDSPTLHLHDKRHVDHIHTLTHSHTHTWRIALAEITYYRRKRTYMKHPHAHN